MDNADDKENDDIIQIFYDVVRRIPHDIKKQILPDILLEINKRIPRDVYAQMLDEQQREYQEKREKIEREREELMKQNKQLREEHDQALKQRVIYEAELGSDYLQVLEELRASRAAASSTL